VRSQTIRDPAQTPGGHALERAPAGPKRWDPPERALVLCVDEKSQIQALNHTAPLLPLRPGIPAQMTHDYQRHGTTSLFAALEVASGKVHGRSYRRHRHQEFIAFLNSLARRYPRRELHLICDIHGTHNHPAVQQWMTAHSRCHIHFTPTSASWLNLVERWFGLITQQAIRRGSFDSIAQLERAIIRFLEHWNQNAQPFTWTRTAARSDAASKTLNLFPKHDTRLQLVVQIAPRLIASLRLDSELLESVNS
jgi:transposase